MTNNTWTSSTLEDISDNLDNKRVPVSKLKRNTGNIPYYGATGIVDYVEDYIFNEKLLLIGEDGADWSPGANTAFIINGKSWVNNHAHVLRITKANADFVMNYLNYADLRQHTTGTTRGKLNKASLMSIKIPTPDLKIQNKVANILTSLDEVIQKTDQIIQQCEQLKMGLVIDIFDKQAGAQMLKMKDISDVTSSKRVMVSDYVEEGVPFYRSTEIIKKSKNISVIKPLYISQEKFDFFKNRFGAPIAGDLLITAVGTIGDVYLVQSETFYFKDGNTVWVRGVKDSVLPEYLKVILSSNYYRELLNNISGGSSQKALTIQKLENVEVPIPSISSQRKIIDLLSSVERNVLVNQKIKANLLVLKQGLMQDIFNQKIELN